MTHHMLSPILCAVIPVFSPDKWLYQLFSPLAVAQGTPLTRDVTDVEAHLGRARFLGEAALRGSHVTENAGVYVLTRHRTAISVML